MAHRAASKSEQKSEPKRLLVVDDDAVICQLTSEMLTRQGYLVEIAENATEAVEKAKKEYFPVVITDLRMPGVHGLSLIERLRGLSPRSVYLVVTGFLSASMDELCRSNDAVISVITKPWREADLLQSLRKAFREQEAREARALSKKNLGSALLLGRDTPPVVEEALQERYRIVRAPKLADAIRTLDVERLELIVSMYDLEDASGIRVVSGLHSRHPQMPIIIVDRGEKSEEGVALLNRGAQDYLDYEQCSVPMLTRAFRYAIERKRAEKSSLALASRDELTRLMNRVTLGEQIAEAISRARNENSQCAVLAVDLESFNTVNTGFGYDQGDLILQEISDRLKDVAGGRDGRERVARIGGDRFVILQEGVESAEACRAFAQRVQSTISTVIELDLGELTMTANIGVAIFPSAAHDAEILLKRAEDAMYQAREQGKGVIRFYEEPEKQDVLPRLRLESALVQALERQEFVLHYQPQLDMRSGEVVGLEALVRWARRDGTMVPPGKFIPLLEESAQILDVGQWILETACERIARWRVAGDTRARMAVNLSARQFEDLNLVSSVDRCLKKFGLPGEALELEITESVLMCNAERTDKMLRELRKLGVRLAIDDFGTGYSSLAYLHRFSVECLKIDRSFVKDLPEHQDSVSIARAIIGLGRKLGLEIVAEGVETPEQLNFLRREGCHLMQGFLMARPQPDWSREDFLGLQRTFLSQVDEEDQRPRLVG